jgi:hypothetical protein
MRLDKEWLAGLTHKNRWLYRIFSEQMSRDHPEWPDTRCTDEHPYTLSECAPGHHYKVVQWYPLACSLPTKVSLKVLAPIKPPRAPLLRLMVLATTNPHIPNQTDPKSVAQSAPPVGTPRLVSTTYYARPYPYRLMVILFSWVAAP